MVDHKLQQAIRLIESAGEDLKAAPEKAAIAELLEALEILENEYKKFCQQCDHDFNEEEGTSYEYGVSLEFYIEASWWHDVSVALRKLKGEVK